MLTYFCTSSSPEGQLWLQRQSIPESASSSLTLRIEKLDLCKANWRRDADASWMCRHARSTGLLVKAPQSALKPSLHSIVCCTFKPRLVPSLVYHYFRSAVRPELHLFHRAGRLLAGFQCLDSLGYALRGAGVTTA